MQQSTWRLQVSLMLVAFALIGSGRAAEVARVHFQRAFFLKCTAGSEGCFSRYVVDEPKRLGIRFVSCRVKTDPADIIGEAWIKNEFSNLYLNLEDEGRRVYGGTAIQTFNGEGDFHVNAGHQLTIYIQGPNPAALATHVVCSVMGDIVTLG